MSEKASSDNQEESDLTNNQEFCSECSIDFDADSIIGCDGDCDGWFHLKCAKLSKDEFNFIDQNKESVNWYCTKCKEINKDLRQEKQKILKENEKLKKQVNMLTQQLNRIKIRENIKILILMIKCGIKC